MLVSDTVGQGRHLINPCTLIVYVLLCNLFLSIHQPHTWNNVHCLCDGDVNKVTWFQKMMVRGA